ncbi:hypothetical protein MRS44_013558 [Fusarium solani]|uniref:uncharacterized protein n=1 Tax=Fusarium solani TaxID=169388 RepID=UPI0032C419E0|nr:hypothetical protein MRS44_013558 [Fusarium solani]
MSPLISVFAILTFGLLWLAQRYAMIYVNRFDYDTGGVLYPRAINQTLTGVWNWEARLYSTWYYHGLTFDLHGPLSSFP